MKLFCLAGREGAKRWILKKTFQFFSFSVPPQVKKICVFIEGMTLKVMREMGRSTVIFDLSFLHNVFPSVVRLMALVRNGENSRIMMGHKSLRLVAD